MPRPPAPVIAPVTGTMEMRLQALADAITRNTVTLSLMREGVLDGSNAAPGQIGEYVFDNRTTASFLSIASGVSTDLASISLTPGDWDVQGAVYFQGSSSSGSDDLRAWVNTVSATQPSGDFGGLAIISTSSGGLVNMLAVPPIRASGTSTTVVYLGCNATYGSGTMQAKGFVRARRMR